MTTSIRKHIPTPLEQKYAEMRKESGDYKRNPNWVKTPDVPVPSMPKDTVTLTGQDNDELALKRSQSVSPVEKQALQIQFSIQA
jgi:hypothetical protein